MTEPISFISKKTGIPAPTVARVMAQAADHFLSDNGVTRIYRGRRLGDRAKGRISKKTGVPLSDVERIEESHAKWVIETISGLLKEKQNGRY